jgi:hypothetical protein
MRAILPSDAGAPALLGATPTGKTVDIGLIDIMECVDDQTAARWGVVDVAAVMEQLGVGAPPGQTRRLLDRDVRRKSSALLSNGKHCR